MTFKDYKVQYFEAGDTTGVILDTVVSVRDTKVVRAKTNSLEIVVDNYAGNAIVDGEIRYKKDEILKVYAADGPVDITNSAHLIGVYFILDLKVFPELDQIKLICGDNTYKLLNQVFLGDKPQQTARTIIENIVQQSAPNGIDSTTVTVVMDTTKSGGGAFPLIDYASDKKTSYEAILELSQTEYTGDDREYIFYFDENGVFYWHYPDQTPNESLSFKYASEPVISMVIDKTESETVSSVIWNAGNDQNGNAITDLYHDFMSTSTNIKYKPMTDISKTLDAMITRGSITVADNDEYIAIAKAVAEARAKAFISAMGRGLWELKIVIPGQIIGVGGLYNCSAPNKGFLTTPLRVERVLHNMDGKGWTTTLTLKQDPDRIEV